MDQATSDFVNLAGLQSELAHGNKLFKGSEQTDMGIILVKDGVGGATNIIKVALRRTQEGKRKRIRP